MGAWQRALRRMAAARPQGGLWRHPDFLKFWAAQAVSGFGSRISRTVLPVAALLTIEASPAEIGILSALSVAPAVLVGMLMGGRVDRSAKRPLLIGADLTRAALLFTIPIAHWLDVLSMHQLYAVAAGVGAASTLFQIADNAHLPALIGRPRLPEANAKLEATDAVAEIGGPGIARVLIEVVTAPVDIGRLDGGRAGVDARRPRRDLACRAGRHGVAPFILAASPLRTLQVMPRPQSE